MPTVTLAVDKLGQVLQIQTEGNSSTNEFGRVRLLETIVLAPTLEPCGVAADRTIAGVDGSIIAMTVAAAIG